MSQVGSEAGGHVRNQAALFAIDTDEHRDGHRYVRVTAIRPDTLAEDLAPRLTAVYFDEAEARASLVAAASELTVFDGSAFLLDDEQIEAALAAQRDAVLPAAWKGDRPRDLDVQRSEFGEIVAADVLEKIFSTVVPARRIAFKEIPDQPTRGADVIGFEELPGPDLVLVLAEVKGSSSEASPPKVVEGMVAKLRSLTSDRRALAQELIWLRDHSDEQHADAATVACASFLMGQERFTILLAPILIRPVERDKPTDPGKFKTDASQIGAPIRWVSIVVPGDLFDLAARAYKLARGGAP